MSSAPAAARRARARRSRRAPIPAPLAIVVLGLVAAVAAIPFPLPVIGLLFVGIIAIAVFAFPHYSLVAMFVLVPLHAAGYEALTIRAHVDPGPLTFWKDALIVALLVRGLIDRYRSQGLSLPRSLPDLFLIAFIAIWAVIACLSPDLHAAGYALAVDVEGPLLLLALVALAPPRRVLVACLVAVAAITVVMAGAALIEQVIKDALPRWYGHLPTSEVYYSNPGLRTGYRSGSFFGDSLILGDFLAATGGALVALIAIARGRLRVLGLVALAICVGGAVVTYTRSAYAGVGLAIVLATAMIIQRPRVRAAMVGIIVVAAGAAALYFYASGDEHLSHGGDAQTHFDLLGNDVSLVADNPLGYGLGSTDRIARRFGVTTVGSQVTSAGSVGPSSESVYLGAAVEGGVIGFVALVSAIFLTGLRLMHARRRALLAGDVIASAATSGAIAAVIGTAVVGLLLNIRELPVEIMWWGIPGIALVLAGERLQRGETAA